MNAVIGVIILIIIFSGLLTSGYFIFNSYTSTPNNITSKSLSTLTPIQASTTSLPTLTPTQAPTTLQPMTSAPIITTASTTSQPMTTAPIITTASTTSLPTLTPTTLQPMTSAPIITTAPTTLQPMTTAPIITTASTTSLPTLTPTQAPTTLQPMTTAPINIINAKATVNTTSPLKDIKFIIKPNSTQNIISFAEIQVFDNNNNNVAKTGIATMSKYINSSGANLGIDNNTDGSYGNGSVVHSEADPNAYWELAFSFPINCSRIVIYNRTDCCFQRLAEVIMKLTFNDNSVQIVNLSGDNIQTILVNSTIYNKPVLEIPISGNTLNVSDNGYSQTSKENNYFNIGTYKNIDINNGSAYCRTSGNPPNYAISCGIPNNQYKYTVDFNVVDRGYSGTKVIMSNVDNTGRSLFCRGVGDSAVNPQMACVGLTADGNAWDPKNQYYMVGKIGNASDYGLKYTP